MKLPFLIVIPVILAGCTTTPPSATERRVEYVCNYGPNLTVTYAHGMARIDGPNETVTLRQRPSSSGFRFESATHSLQGVGDHITYKDRQMAPKTCQASS